MMGEKSDLAGPETEAAEVTKVEIMQFVGTDNRLGSLAFFSIHAGHEFR